MSNKCVHEWYYRIVDIVSWQFFCIRCGEKLSMDKFSDRATELEKNVDALNTRIAELEAERRWVPVSERLPEEEGWYYAGVLGRFGDHYTHDVYFYAEDAAFRWKDCEGDKVYCWLDGVPEMPKPPEERER